jgi:mercuric reductase
LAAIVAQKNELVADVRQHKYLNLADSYGFEVIRGDALLCVGDSTLQIGSTL